MNSITALGTIRGLFTFLEASFTVVVAGLGTLMIANGSYTWPSKPGIVYLGVMAAAAGVRRINALLFNGGANVQVSTGVTTNP